MNVVRYMGETFLLMTLSGILQKYLSVHTDAERVTARDEFFETYRLRLF